jgi:F-type H+-transporting ATPase subunit a
MIKCLSMGRLLLGFGAAATAFAAETGGGHEQTLTSVLMHHITNEPYAHPLLVQLGVTKAVAMMLLSSGILIAMFALAMRPGRLAGAPQGWTNALESLVVFIRDEMAYNSMGERYGRMFTPFLCTLFFFVLTCNLIGMVPGMYTPTSNLNVTAALALLSLALIVISGVIVQGPVGYVKHMIPPGTPVALIPLLLVIEILGLFVKPVALMIRLAANMTAGHIVIVVMLGFIFIFKSFAVAPLAVPLAVAITILEIIVAFIQAYVFTLLSALFIGMVVHPSH